MESSLILVISLSRESHPSIYFSIGFECSKLGNQRRVVVVVVWDD